jgi:hypothetical protein
MPAGREKHMSKSDTFQAAFVCIAECSSYRCVSRVPNDGITWRVGLVSEGREEEEKELVLFFFRVKELVLDRFKREGAGARAGLGYAIIWA